jgi:hypothetical protein
MLKKTFSKKSQRRLGGSLVEMPLFMGKMYGSATLENPQY